MKYYHSIYSIQLNYSSYSSFSNSFTSFLTPLYTSTKFYYYPNIYPVFNAILKIIYYSYCNKSILGKAFNKNGLIHIAYKYIYFV